jgi:hypothetical protein
MIQENLAGPDTLQSHYMQQLPCYRKGHLPRRRHRRTGEPEADKVAGQKYELREKLQNL